jgi:hypothetical protein
MLVLMPARLPSVYLTLGCRARPPGVCLARQLCAFVIIAAAAVTGITGILAVIGSASIIVHEFHYSDPDAGLYTGTYGSPCLPLSLFACSFVVAVR